MAKTLTVSPSSGKDIGNGVTARFEFQQVKSASSGKVYLQIRAIFNCVDYGSSGDRELGAAMHVKLGNSASASDNIFTEWAWTRHRGDTIVGPWISLNSINSASSLTFYIIINNGYAPSSGDVNWGTITVSGIARCLTLTRTLNSHVSSLTYSITDRSGLNGGNRTNQTATTAIVYDSDTYSWSATAETGYTLSSSSGSGTVNGSSITIAPTASLSSYKLTLTRGSNTSLTVTKNGTSLSNGSTIYYGDKLVVSFSANTGYTASASCNGSSISNGSTVTVSSALSISSSATINSYTITINKGPHTNIIVKNGSTTINSGAKVNYGTSLSVSILADAGYKISSRFPDGSTLTVTGNHTIYATAEPMATVRIKTSSGWGIYLIHIRSGGAWKQYQARIKNSSGWGIYS